MLLSAPAFGEGMPGSYCSLVEEAPGTAARGARILGHPRGGCCGYRVCASSWLAPVGSASPNPAPWLLSWLGDLGSGMQLSGAIPVLAGASVSPRAAESPGPACAHTPNGSGGFCAAWARVGEQSARPAGCEIASLEAAHGHRD